MSASPGYAATIKATGTPTTFTAEACSLVSGKTYQIDATAKRAWDPLSSLAIYDNGSRVAAADVESVSLLFGRVTFASSYSVTGPVTASGKYLPLSTLTYARGFVLRVGGTLLDVSPYGSQARQWSTGPEAIDGALDVLGRGGEVYDGGSRSLDSVLRSGEIVVIEVLPEASTALRVFAVLERSETGGVVSDVIANAVQFRGAGASSIDGYTLDFTIEAPAADASPSYDVAEAPYVIWGGDIGDGSTTSENEVSGGASWTQTRNNQAGPVTTAAAVKVGSYGLSGFNQAAVNFGFMEAPWDAAIGSASFTIATWVKVNALAVASSRTVLGTSYYGSWTDGFEMYLDLQAGNVYRPSFYVRPAAVSVTDGTGATDFAADEWHHVAATYNGTTRLLSLYVDGALVDSTTLSVGDYVAPSSPRTFRLFGYPHNIEGGASWDNQLHGYLDVVSFWTSERSASEIAAVYTAGAAGVEFTYP